MGIPIAPASRLSIRQSIERNAGQAIISTTTALGTTSTLIDTYGLVRGTPDEYTGWQVQINSTVSGGASVGQKAWVTLFDPATKTITLAPALDAAVKAGQAYEMVKYPLMVEDINDMLDQAIRGLSDDCLVEVQEFLCTQRDSYEYPLPSGQVGVYMLDYCTRQTEKVLSDCESLWAGRPGELINVELDGDQYRVGTCCNRIKVGTTIVAGDYIASITIPATDLSNYPLIEMWIKVNLDVPAGSLLLCLSTGSLTIYNDSVNLPALWANEWTHCIMPLAYPQVDTAITTLVLKQHAAYDTGLCTIWIDDIKATRNEDREWKMLNPEYWGIISGTPAISLTAKGRSLTGINTVLRLRGYRIPAVLADDTTNSEVDPDYLINKVTGQLLVKTGPDQAQYYLSLAEDRLKKMTTLPDPVTRWI